jgi:hypothetical protein
VPAVEVEGMPSLYQMLEVARKLRMEKEREKELQVRLVLTPWLTGQNFGHFAECYLVFV